MQKKFKYVAKTFKSELKKSWLKELLNKNDFLLGFEPNGEVDMLHKGPEIRINITELYKVMPETVNIDFASDIQILSKYATFATAPMKLDFFGTWGYDKEKNKDLGDANYLLDQLKKDKEIIAKVLPEADIKIIEELESHNKESVEYCKELIYQLRFMILDSFTNAINREWENIMSELNKSSNAHNQNITEKPVV